MNAPELNDDSLSDTTSAPEFRNHQTNTRAPPNEQAGTAVSEQPLFFGGPSVTLRLLT